MSTQTALPSSIRTGAIVLCGGQSTRMGAPKATLPFGDEVMLQRVVRLVAAVVPPQRIAVVAAADQDLPALASEITIARDAHAQRGPLEGLAAGLRALSDRVDACYASSCDAPLLKPEFIAEVFRQLGDAQICVPRDGRFYHPLAAVYRSDVLPAVEALLAADRLRPAFLFQSCRTHQIEVDALRIVDAELHSLQNVNRPEDYEAALATAFS